LVVTIGDEVDSIRISWFSIDSEEFSFLLDSILFRIDESKTIGGFVRGRRWNGMNGDERVLIDKHWLHRHKWWLIGSLITEHSSFCLLSCLENRKNISKKLSNLFW
jgi:hypothetical protein